MAEWLEETLYPGWGQRFEVEALIAHERSEFQDITIVQTRSHGRVLVLDGIIQITEADDFVYQEMIVHVPLLEHGSAKRVLVIGGGDGGVLRRVLQHRTVELATLVEIDSAVIRLAQAHLPHIGGDAWRDSRVSVIVGDGIQHVANSENAAYDVIIVDSTDPVSVGEVLFTEQFYADCARALTPGGILVNQCGVPFMQPEELRETSERKAKSFPQVTAYLIAVPTYVGGFMALGFAAKTGSLERLSMEIIQARALDAGILGQTQYWSPGMHVAAFELPPYISRCLPGHHPGDGRTGLV